MKKTLRFKAKNSSQFSSVLKQRVAEYFKDKPSGTKANTQMHIKTAFLMLMWISNYLLIISGVVSYPFSFLVWAFMGVSIALVTTNIGHDAIHGAYTRNDTLKFILELTFNLNGASAYMWRAMHNTAHHTYTNIHGYDEDISPVPVLRLSPEAELKPIHRYQHIYAPIFYFIGTLSWVFIKDYVKFFKNEVGNINNVPHKPSEYVNLFLYKGLYYTLYIGLPLFLLPQPWYITMLGFLAMHMVSGFYLAIVFMLAHAVEDVHFPVPEATGVVENDWFIHQMYTTANFASDSRIASFLTGGLNQQVEHHLFSTTCSIHYRPLSKIVRQTAEEFGVPYYDAPTFWSALVSHFKFLKAMGREKDYSPKHQFTPGVVSAV
ncbi:MAG: acyl-CoA desaturase [Bacteroidia bacterium]|nr:acyl-CoA desaturase [Bacteroidia bacterium]